MRTLLYMIATVAIGILLSVQPPMNAVLARSVGSAYGATAISIFIALLTILAFTIFTGHGEITRKTLTSVPLWIYLSGIVGAIFVAGGAAVAPVTGAMVFFVCIVGGQFLGSTLIDHFGAFGLEVRKISVMRIIGLLLIFGGAVMVSRG